MALLTAEKLSAIREADAGNVRNADGTWSHYAAVGESIPSMLDDRRALVGHVAAQDAEIARLRAENEGLRELLAQAERMVGLRTGVEGLIPFDAEEVRREDGTSVFRVIASYTVMRPTETTGTRHELARYLIATALHQLELDAALASAQGQAERAAGVRQ